MADVMLERNSDDTYRNRPLNNVRVRRYARGMERGWKITGETIIFSNDGVLLNGQTRLTACIHAGVSFSTFVAFGIEREAFKYMDGDGACRTASDVFSTELIPN